MEASFLTFLGLSAVVIATPGPDTALTVRNTFLGGRRAGMFTALGVSAGQVLWSVATSLGRVVAGRRLILTSSAGPGRVINNLANSKMAVFFASVVPQCAPVGDGMLSVLLLLGVLFSVLTLLWLTLYAVIFARAGQFVRGSRVGRAIDGTAGMVLIGLGVKVATGER